jgi:hypothetical protein
MNLSNESLDDAIKSMRDSIGNRAIKAKPTTLLVYPPYLKMALRILGLIKQPVQKASGLRKRKKALYWRKTV